MEFRTHLVQTRAIGQRTDEFKVRFKVSLVQTSLKLSHQQVLGIETWPQHRLLKRLRRDCQLFAACLAKCFYVRIHAITMIRLGASLTADAPVSRSRDHFPLSQQTFASAQCKVKTRGRAHWSRNRRLAVDLGNIVTRLMLIAMAPAGHLWQLTELLPTEYF